MPKEGQPEQACRYNGASEREDSDSDPAFEDGDREREAMLGVAPPPAMEREDEPGVVPPAMLEDGSDVASMSDDGDDGDIEYTCDGIAKNSLRSGPITPFSGLLLLASWG